MTDILTSHPSLLAPVPPAADESSSGEASPPEPSPLLKPISKMYTKSLRGEPRVQTTGATALSKLLLAGTLHDADLLKQMVLAYFDPETASNPSLRQALTYFLPVYCHSRAANATALARVAVPVVRFLGERAEDLDEEIEMVGLANVGAQLVDWTDPRKCVGLEIGLGEEPGEDGHLVLVEEVLEKVLSPGCNSEWWLDFDVIIDCGAVAF